jgi:hypothetical protein
MQSGKSLEENLKEEISKDLDELKKLPEETTTQQLYKSLWMLKTTVNAMTLLEVQKEAKRKQDEFNTYFVLSLQLPFVDKVYQVGCYHTEKLAQTINSVIHEALKNELKIKEFGWFELRTDPYKGNLIQCPAGLRLEEPGSAITMVQTQLTFQELVRLGNWVPSTIEHALSIKKEPAIMEEREIVIRKQAK